jgi:ubiquinone/menaquinone biosynthesis C-methylase UbiE
MISQQRTSTDEQMLFDELGQYWAEIADSRWTQEESTFIVQVLRSRGQVLDLCCGTARHSILLAEKGWPVLGLDISPNLLRIAKERMKQHDVRFPLIRGDMRYLPFRAEVFAAVFNMFTSFGYLPSEQEDVESLNEISRTLRRRGLFLLDVANRDHLLSTFKKKDWGEFPSFYMLEKRTLGAEGSRLHSEWTLVDKRSGKVERFDHNLRLYSLGQLENLCAEAGLTPLEFYGDYDGQGFQLDSRRLILLAQRVL